MIEQGQIFATRYQMQHLLGRGAFSEVWLANDTKAEGLEVAIKVYAPSTGLDDKGLQMFAHEFATVMNINHRNLLKPIYFDDYERQPYLVLPYCRRGSVESAVGEMSEREAWTMIRDVAAGLAELHSKQPPVVHQDIKPANIMQDDEGRYLIADFGVSTKLRSTLRRSQAGKGSDYDSAGTTAYMAPERFGRQNKPIMANDVYSLGATMFEMLTGDVPFGNLGGIIYHQGADLPELDCSCSQQLKDVVERCLAKDPWDRPVAAQLEEWAKIGLKGGVIDFSRKWEGDEPVAPPSGGTGGGGRPTERKHNDSGTGKDGDPPTPAFGALSVSSIPTGAEVYIDGTHVGITPATFPGLSVGTHEVEMRKEGYVSATQTATIRAGREAAVSLTLQAISAPAPAPTPTKSGIMKWVVALVIFVFGFLLWFVLRVNGDSVSSPSGFVSGHAYVDLGLSVKWATCNVGASSPGDCGNYYAWGETTTKYSYDTSNSKTYKNSSYVHDIGGNPNLDAARANWGGTWRLPTVGEFQELINDCKWQWTTQGSYNGYKVTSKKNGNSIFLPAAGGRGGSSLNNAGENGYYWSSSPYGGSSDYACSLYFYSSLKDLTASYRYWGLPVRPVSE